VHDASALSTRSLLVVISNVFLVSLKKKQKQAAAGSCREFVVLRDYSVPGLYNGSTIQNVHARSNY
jgi:hypothetical protein